MPTNKPMNRAEFERIGSHIWGGHGWKGAAAVALKIDRKTVSRWIAGDHVPGWAADQLRAMAHIAPPPGSTSDEDRDDACADAIEGDLSRLMDLALSAGWHRGEVLTAMLSLVLTDIQVNAGDDAVLELLDQARDRIRAA